MSNNAYEGINVKFKTCNSPNIKMIGLKLRTLEDAKNIKGIYIHEALLEEDPGLLGIIDTWVDGIGTETPVFTPVTFYDSNRVTSLLCISK